MTAQSRAITAIRMLAADSVQKANSGHPGMPIGSAPMAYAIWKQMKHNPKDPAWQARDRFVLSAGHASMLEYALLHLFGYPLGIEDLKAFRQWGSKTPGHPEYGHTVGVEATSGPLGQGIAMAAGMAIREALEAGADIIMLDNMSCALMREAVEITAGRAVLEASGNMGERDLAEVAATGVDLISIGGLTHSVKALDISLKFDMHGM